MTDSAEKVDAWMPLWIGSYLADTMTLTTVQHGAYLLLLIAYWRNRGPLDDDDEDLASIVKASPGEWKKLRAKLTKFFDISGGKWTHGRADKELVIAGLRKAAASSKAKAAAEARWKKSTEQCSKHAPSIAPAQPEQCPTPSPSPGNTEDGLTPPPTAGAGAPPSQGVAPDSHATPSAVVCIALRRAGIASVNPASPKLQALIDAGATAAEFVAHVAKALAEAQDPFRYVLGAVEGERKRAANTTPQLHRGPMPAAAPAQSFRERDADSAASTVRAFAPGVAARPSGQAASPLTLDMEP